jgi:hypothetical protein
MGRHVRPEIVANELRMMRTQHKGTLVIVEGPSDKSAFLSLLSKEACRIVIAHGKENALEVLKTLESEGFPGILAIVDADFSHLEGSTPSSANALRTDLHDLECMMAASPAFDKLLNEYAVAERVDAIQRKCGCALAILVATNAMAIGYLRWVSLRKSLGFEFDGLSFAKFVSRSDIRIDVPALIQEVKNRSQRHELDDSVITSHVDALRDVRHDPWQVSCGHDILEMLSYALRRTIAAHKESAVKREALERSLRFAYEAAHSRATQLFSSIRDWEAAHPQYDVLPR